MAKDIDRRRKTARGRRAKQQQQLRKASGRLAIVFGGLALLFTTVVGRALVAPQHVHVPIMVIFLAVASAGMAIWTANSWWRG